MAEPLRQPSAEFLARRHHLMAFIQWLACDDTLAEDVFQQVWIQLAASERAGTEIRELDKWCRTVARSILLQKWRKEQARGEVVDSRLVELADRAFEEQDGTQGMWAERTKVLKECIRGLPRKSRRMLALKYDEGLPVARIAEILKRTYDSVMMGLSRVRGSLRRCVERRLQAAER